MLVDGHTAVYCGNNNPAPHDADGSRLPQTSGAGHARCSCGQVSADLLSSGNARRRWHVRHKEEVAVVPWSDAALNERRQ